jgi:hypothetical protein
MPPSEKVSAYGCKCSACGFEYAYRGTAHPSDTINCGSAACQAEKRQATMKVRELSKDEATAAGV